MITPERIRCGVIPPPPSLEETPPPPQRKAHHHEDPPESAGPDRRPDPGASTFAAAPALAQTPEQLRHQSAEGSADLYFAGLANPLTQGSVVFATVGSGGLWLLGCVIQDTLFPGTADCSF